MNRLDKLRDEKAVSHSKKHVATWTASGKKAVAFGFKSGWDACASEFEQIVKELEGALETIEKGFVVSVETSEYAGFDKKRVAEKALYKLKAWRGQE